MVFSITWESLGGNQACFGDAANLDELDRLFDIVKREKGKIDVLFASESIVDPVLLLTRERGTRGACGRSTTPLAASHLSRRSHEPTTVEMSVDTSSRRSEII
jgi:hypothetical protein